MRGIRYQVHHKGTARADVGQVTEPPGVELAGLARSPSAVIYISGYRVQS
jgi:hypothetical protein